jgi:uncharacterized protein (TIGR02145 family)
MDIFTRQGLGRTLLLTAVLVIGTVCVSNGADNPSALAGRWFFVDGYNKERRMNPMSGEFSGLEVVRKSVELFSDGTGLVDGESVTWKAENNRIRLLSPGSGIVADYNVSDYELVLTYDDGQSATFVRKEKLEEYNKKKEEQRKRDAELRAEEKKKEDAQKLERMKKEAEKNTSYFTDKRDGQKYRAVKIGGVTWMAQNLNYQPKKGQNWCYDNDNSNCEKYGRLYSEGGTGSLCPDGWRYPSARDWNDLEKTVAVGGNMAGAMLKSVAGWTNNGNGLDAFGFSGLPGGMRNKDGSFKSVGQIGGWWTWSQESGQAPIDYVKWLLGGNNGVTTEIVGDVTGRGYSVRCIQK